MQQTQDTEANVAAAIVADPEIRKLPAGSEEYREAVEAMNKPKEPKAKAEGETEEGETEPKKTKAGLERRFSEITSERDAAKARAAELERQLAAITAAKPNAEPQFTADEYDTPKPSPDDFDTYNEYVEALADWKFEKREHDREQQQQLKELQKVQQEVVTTWNTKEQATRARVEGYDQLVDKDFIDDFTSNVASPAAMQYLLEGEHGPDVLYALAEDDEQLKKFKALTPVKQVAFLAKIEAQFEIDEEPEAPKPKVSKAPTPPKALPKGHGSNAGVKDFAATGGSFAEYQAWRDAQPKANGF